MRLLTQALLLLFCSACARRIELPERITLTRSGCFGYCPVYSLRIDSSGTVRYEGIGYAVMDPGAQSRTDSTNITRAQFAAISAAFDSTWSRLAWHRYTWGLPSCPQPSTDSPTMHIIREGATVSDTLELYYGCDDAPKQLDQLGSLIDSLVMVGRFLGKPPT